MLGAAFQFTFLKVVLLFMYLPLMKYMVQLQEIFRRLSLLYLQPQFIWLVSTQSPVQRSDHSSRENMYYIFFLRAARQRSEL